MKERRNSASASIATKMSLFNNDSYHDLDNKVGCLLILAVVAVGWIIGPTVLTVLGWIAIAILGVGYMGFDYFFGGFDSAAQAKILFCLVLVPCVGFLALILRRHLKEILYAIWVIFAVLSLMGLFFYAYGIWERS
jgi:nucleoside permease NupC